VSLRPESDRESCWLRTFLLEVLLVVQRRGLVGALGFAMAALTGPFMWLALPAEDNTAELARLRAEVDQLRSERARQ
jgi:hypothetical protein